MKLLNYELLHCARNRKMNKNCVKNVALYDEVVHRLSDRLEQRKYRGNI